MKKLANNAANAAGSGPAGSGSGSGAAEKGLESGPKSGPGSESSSRLGEAPENDLAGLVNGQVNGQVDGQVDGPVNGPVNGQVNDSANDLVVVLCTFPKPEDIGEIAFTLIGANLCACVNVLSESLSIYRWRGEIVTNKEVLCLIKTTRARHAELVARLSELHPYEVPEIVTLPTWAVNEPYLRWVQDETDPHRSSTGPIRLADLQERMDGESEE